MKECKKIRTRNSKGITLIALVITIIVLLILAGVSIAMLTGDNGILTQANNAKVEQSHGAVRDGIALAYNEYQIEINTANNTKIASTEVVTVQGEEVKAQANTYTSFLDFLSKKSYADSSTGKINVEALTGSKQSLGNGTDTDVYKIEEENGNYVVNYYDEANQKEQIWSITNNEISTDNIEITTAKVNMPNNENIEAVLLTVDKILLNGTELTKIVKVTVDEYRNMLLEKLETMTDGEKESIFVDLINISSGMNFSDINEFIEYAYNQGEIEENSKDAFYEKIGGKENFHDMLVYTIYDTNYNLIGNYNKETEELQRYTITNPDEEDSNIYIATQNGDYTFTVEIGNTQYTKTLNVDNIVEGQIDDKYIVERIYDYDFEYGLKDIETNNFTTFTNAYIVCNNNLVDVSSNIYNEDNISYISTGDFADMFGLDFSDEPIKTVGVFVKDGVNYYGEIEIKAEG